MTANIVVQTEDSDLVAVLDNWTVLGVTLDYVHSVLLGEKDSFLESESLTVLQLKHYL
jgi:hypothetical protein